jgi:hypothetical protein
MELGALGNNLRMYKAEMAAHHSPRTIGVTSVIRRAPRLKVT